MGKSLPRMSGRDCCARLLALGLLAAGCHNSKHSDVSASFGAAEAMKILYANYNASAQTSQAALPKEKTPFPDAGEQQMTVKMLFSAFTNDDNEQHFVLVTYAVPRDEGFECHACAPTIGMGIFSHKGPEWAPDASNRAITISGGWGKPPTDIRLVQVGPKRHAVEIKDVGGGQGETTVVLQLLVPWNGTVNLGLERIIADDNRGACDSDGGLPCYAHRRTLNFIRKDDTDYDQLELKLEGTDLPPDSGPAMRARNVSGLETLRFENGKYVQISRSGDLTIDDDAVAERENLK